MKKLLQFPLMAMYQLIKIRRKTTEKERTVLSLYGIENCSPIDGMKKKRSEIYQNRGLSLIEVLVAVSIVSVLLVSMVAAITKSMASAQISKNRSLASSYLQEGLEIARYSRDHSASWEDFVSGCCSDTSPPPPSFIRTIENKKIDSNGNCNKNTDDKCRIIVTVSWTDSKGGHNLTNSTILSNW